MRGKIILVMFLGFLMNCGQKKKYPSHTAAGCQPEEAAGRYHNTEGILIEFSATGSHSGKRPRCKNVIRRAQRMTIGELGL